MAWQTVCCLLLAAVACSNAQIIPEQTCTREGNSADIQPGSTAMLGGILSFSNPGSNGYGCGKPSGSMQRLEAIRWVLDLLNKKNERIQTEFVNDTYVPGVTLGMKVINNCHSRSAAVASIGQVYEGLQGHSSECSKRTNELVFGIIGGSSSDEASDLSLALQLYDIPLISYEATAPKLTTSGDYPNFMRTVAPDSYFTEVMVQVMMELGWKYVVIVYDSGRYGTEAYNELHSRVVANGLCLSTAVAVDGSDLSDNNMDSVLNRVLSTETIGVAFFGTEALGYALLRRAGVRTAETGDLQWMFTNFPVDTSLNIPYMRGVISVSLAYRFIVEFEDHWIRLDGEKPSAENPWFKEWFEEKNVCSFTPIPGQTDCKALYPGMTATEIEKQKRQNFQQDQFVEPAVMAVFTYAKALRMAQKAKCGASGICQALASMDRADFFENYLKKVDFTFTSDERVPSLASKNIQPYDAAMHLSFTAQGDMVNPSFYVWNYNDYESGQPTGNYKFRRVGTYINNYLTLNSANIVMYNKARDTRLVPTPKSICTSTICSSCLDLPIDIKYFYQPGDIVINGIFSLHNKGTGPMSCGTLKSTNQVMYMEAMIYALNRINNDASILPNIKLGGLGFDDCSSDLIGKVLLSQVQRGTLIIYDANQNALHPDNVESYLAAYSSPLTDYMGEVMNTMKHPLVSYRAGSPKLDDQATYPYFARSAPFMREEIRAIILLLKKHNWMYVQVVTSGGSYAMEAYKLFRDLAAKEGICVVATHNIGGSTTTAHDAVMGLSYHIQAPVAISLLERDEQRMLLMAFNSTSASANIKLIASTGWGTSKSVVKSFESAAEGVITLSLKHSTLDQFKSYLMQLRTSTQDAIDPWFMEWFMAAYQCDSGMQNCDTSKAINDASLFDVIYEVESVINGVKALARALDDTLTQYCGAGYTTVCSAFTNAGDRGMQYMEKLRKTTFSIEDMTPPMDFKFIGSTAAIPFNVNQFKNGVYEQIGSINPYVNTIQMSDMIDSTQPMCPQPCIECLYMFNHQEYLYVPGDVMIGVIFNIHYAGTGPFDCGDVRIFNGALYTEIFQFALNQINAGLAGSGLNVKIGGYGFDGCSNPTRAHAIINRVNSGSMMIDNKIMNFPDILAWVTYDSETTRDSSLFLKPQGIPVVSPGATNPELRDLTKFDTLYRTASSDALIVKGMADFINKMGWKYVFILNSPDASNRESARLLREYLKGFGICALSQYEFVTDGSMEVILNSLNSATSQVVAVLAEPDQYIQDFLDTKINKNLNQKLQFIANRPWTPYVMQTKYRNTLDDSVFFAPTAQTINDLNQYISNIDVMNSVNPWIEQIYKELFNCNLPGTFTDQRSNCVSPYSKLNISPKYSQDIWAQPTIDAVYALAEAAHRTLKDKCGNSYTGICSTFSQASDTHEKLMEHIEAMTVSYASSVSFKFIKNEIDRNLNFYRFDGSIQSVGNLDTAGILNLNNEAAIKAFYSNVQSKCTADCLACLDSDAIVQDFSHIPGDVYIVGLFDIHKTGSTPYSCSGINEKHGAHLLEAFHFALDYANNRNGIFEKLGIIVGGVGLDMCKSATRAANLVANIHSKKVVLKSQGITIDPSRIDAYIGTMDTESSIRVGDILDQLLIPQISYGATGIELLDREKYPYFFRSVPADNKMGRAIISYLKKFNYNNIQVVKSFDEIGLLGATEFERLAVINLVCVQKTYLIGENGDLEVDSENIMSNLAANTNAQAIVMWMKDPLPFLKAVNKRPDLYKNFLFIATDKWGADPDYLAVPYIQNILNEKNLILLDIETADVPGFDNYLAEKTPDNYNRNPWFKEYFDKAQNCSWDAGTCQSLDTIPRRKDYVQDPYVLYVVNAVFSAVKAIEDSIIELCGTGSLGVCNSYDTSGERKQKVLAHLKKLQFTDDTHQPFYFMADGQSDRGFHFYNVTGTTPNIKYENVGSYNDSHFMKLDITYDNDYTALCDPYKTDASLVDCVCPFTPPQPTRFMKKEQGNRGLTLVYVGDIHQADPANNYACGKINTNGDLYRMLAFFYAINRINTNAGKGLPDSIRFNGIAIDSCSTSLRLGQDVYNLLSGNKLCDSDETEKVISPNSIVAFITDKDKNAIHVSSMLSPKGITSISPTATHISLDNAFQHGTFLRTIGSDNDNVQVILEVADKFSWDMIGVIYTDIPKHQMAKEALFRTSSTRTNQICIGASAALAADASTIDIHDALDEISQKVGVTAVVLFVEPEHFRQIMESSNSMGTAGILWIVPSTWAGMATDIQQYKAELTSSIWIKSNTSEFQDFNDYVKQITFTNKMGIPDDWFQEIYETIHKCSILDFTERSKLYSTICQGNEQITDAMITKDPAILQVIISVYAAAHGLNNIPECTGSSLDISACLQLQSEKNALIYGGIQGARFQVLPELLKENTFTFAFNRDGNGEADYLINTLDENGHVIHVGGYTDGGLTFNDTAYKSTTSFSNGGVPSSKCAVGAVCDCYGANNVKYSFSSQDVESLVNVQAGQQKRNPKTQKIILITDVPKDADRFDDIWAIVVLVLAIIGAVIALILFGYLLVMYPVRGGTSILGYITSFGIVLLYLMVIPFIYHANDQICALRRFGLGVVYAIVYSALLVKLLDCCRVRKKKDAEAKYNKLGRPLGLFFMVVFLVLVQCMINAEWLILEEPTMERVFYNDLYWPRCSPDNFYDESLVLSLCYVMALIFVSFCLGIYTFTLPTNHKESRWIFSIIILSIPCFVIWCAVSIIGPYKVRDAAVAVGLLINATFVLLLMPIRKLYLLGKYNKMIEEEDQMIAEGNSEYNVSVYGRQYDNTPQMHMAGSVRGSSIGYAVSGTQNPHY